MRLPLLLLAALCAAAVAAAPAAAATTVTTAGSQLVVAAMPGVDNHVTIEPGATPATVRVGDTADLVTTSDPACVVSAGAVECPAAASAQVGLGDGNDTLAASTAPVPLTVDAGDGNDVVRVDEGLADTVACGDGADDASAADAQDALSGCEETPATAGAPETTIPTHPLGLTRQTTAAFAFGATEPATFECALDGGAYAACGAAKSYDDLADGGHALLVRAVDAIGNVDATPATWTWTVDTLRPQTVVTGGPATSAPVASATATLAFTSTTAGRFECSLDGGAWKACTSPATYGGLADGAHSFAVRAVDAAGNADGTPATRAWTVRADGSPTARIAVTREGDGFALSGAGSTDPDGDALTYRWLQNDRPAGAGATIHYAAPDTETRDVFTLTVVDAGGRRGQATVALRTRATTERGARETMDVIPFAAGTRLATGARARIAALKRAITGGGATVRVDGYARPSATAARIARARAQAAGRLLLAGAPRSTRTTVAGHGAGGAVASNATAAGRARNDRVVVTVRATGPVARLVTEQEGDPAVSRTNAPGAASGGAGRSLKLFAFWSNVPGGLRRLEEVGSRVEVLAPNWYALSPADASIRGGRPNARVMRLSRRLGFAVWPVVNATMKGAPLLDTPAGRTRIVTQITALAARYRLAGVTLDMEEMLPRQRAAYSTLVAQLSGALHAAQRKLAVYAVRRTATDVGDGAAAYDWAALARSADLVLASGYNEHSAVTSPGPVTTGAGFAAVAQYAAATSKTKIAPAMGAFGYQWAGGGARMVSSADAERRWPVAAEPGSADGRHATDAAAPTWYESAEDLWARERAAAQAGARWIGLFTLGREPARYWERPAAR